MPRSEVLAVAPGTLGGPCVLLADRDRSWSAATPAEASQAIAAAPLVAVHGAGRMLTLLARAGVTLPRGRLADTETMARLQWPMGVPHRRNGQLLPDHDLGRLVCKLTGVPVADGAEATATWVLWSWLRLQFTPEQWQLLARETRLTLLLHGITERGLRVEVPQTATLLRSARERRDFLADALQPLGFTANFATRKDRERLAGVVRRRGAQVVLGDDGQLAVKDADLRRIAAACPDLDPLIEAIIECRRIGPEMACYLQPLLDLRDFADRVHPEIDALAARTGRMSIARPPVQEFPVRSGGPRSCLLAEPGEALVSADLSQIEFRIAAGLSGDPALRRALVAGDDLHAITAARLYGSKFSASERNLAKRAGFARLYGGGASAVADGCGVSLRLAEGAVSAFDASYPRLREWCEELSARQLHVLPSGRKVATDPARRHTPANYVIQGAARDVFAYGLLRIADAGLASRLWLVVHDEVIVSVPGREAEAVARQLEELLSGDFMGVPITARAKILGSRWGQSAPEEGSVRTISSFADSSARLKTTPPTPLLPQNGHLPGKTAGGVDRGVGGGVDDGVPAQRRERACVPG